MISLILLLIISYFCKQVDTEASVMVLGNFLFQIAMLKTLQLFLGEKLWLYFSAISVDFFETGRTVTLG